jgi:hypothetical protein
VPLASLQGHALLELFSPIDMDEVSLDLFSKWWCTVCMCHKSITTLQVEDECTMCIPRKHLSFIPSLERFFAYNMQMESPWAGTTTINSLEEPLSTFP